MTGAEISVNGRPRPWRSGLLLSELVGELTSSGRGVAVAIDREVVPRSAWTTTELRAGAVIEIVTAAAGG